MGFPQTEASTKRRRDVLISLGGAAVAWPLSARAQKQAVQVVGFLSGASETAWVTLVTSFRRGLAETGYVEGKNLVIEFRWAEGRYERLPELASDLVRRDVAVLVATGGPPSIRAAIAATKTIPIVFTLGGDPIEQGFVASLGRPGANATGVTMFTRELLPKRLELLHEVVPKAAKIAILTNPNNPATSAYKSDLQGAARSLQRQTFFLTASSERELGTVFENLILQRAGGLLIVTDPLFETQRTQITTLAARYAIATIHAWREDAEAGGLMSYGASIEDSYRQAGIYTGKILQGARPAELPIQQPTKFEFIINLKTAKALGMIIPASLLARADEVIE